MAHRAGSNDLARFESLATRGNVMRGVQGTAGAIQEIGAGTVGQNERRTTSRAAAPARGSGVTAGLATQLRALALHCS
jgi:hypothetical protein